MSEALTSQAVALSAETMEAVVVGGDLAKLQPVQRLEYYKARCDAAGIDPRTCPFAYIWLPSPGGGGNKLTLYALKGCADQLTAKHKISLKVTNKERDGDLYVVWVQASTNDGRATEDMGAVPLAGAKRDRETGETTAYTLDGVNLANAMMKAVTKAKRRAVLSICGMGMTDESEIEAIEGAHIAKVNMSTGELLPETSAAATENARMQAEMDAFTQTPPKPARCVLGIPITISKTWEQVKTVPVSNLNPKSPFAKLSLGELIDENVEDGRIEYLENDVIRKVQDTWNRMTPKKKLEGLPLPMQLALIAYDRLQEIRSPAPTTATELFEEGESL